MTDTATAIVFEEPGNLSVRPVTLPDPGPGDCVVDIEWSGISTGTERLLWQGRMPPFPGLAYPLVPGYESVGRIASADEHSGLRAGQRVFVPGSRGFTDVHGLFGGAAERLVVDASRVIPLLDEQLGEEGALLALAATARRAVTRAPGGVMPGLIVGHGVLGRLLARLVIALGGEPPVVWERCESRRSGGEGYSVIDPREDREGRYDVICDVSGDAAALDDLIGHLAPGGTVVLAGFYHDRVSFNFPAAFMREATLRVAAEWRPVDLSGVIDLLSDGQLSLAGLITHHAPVTDADTAYRTAFGDDHCLKMILDWRRDHD